MKKTICFLFIISFFSIFFNSCVDEYDKAPEIKFNTPEKNQIFQYGDTIFIRAKITDEIPIKSISAELLDADKIPRTSQYKTDYNSTGISYYEEIVLNISKLTSGNYFLHIIARNENNSKSVFLPITINGLQWKLTGIFLITKISEQQTGVAFINENGDIINIATLQGDYLASGMNIEYQSLIVSGENTGDLSILNTEDGLLAWSIPNSISELHPFFNSLHISDNRIFSGQRNSSIQCYDFAGSLVNSYEMPGERLAKNILYTQNRLFAETEDVLGGTRRLIQYYAGSSPITDHTIIQDIISWDYYNDRLIIFANVNNTGKIYTYNFINNVFTLQKTTESLIVTTTSKQGSEFFVVCQNAIYVYDASVQNNLTKVIDQANIKNIFHDNSGKNIFIHDTYNIYVFNTDTYQMIEQFVSPNEILNIHGRYSAITE